MGTLPVEGALRTSFGILQDNGELQNFSLRIPTTHPNPSVLGLAFLRLTDDLEVKFLVA